MMPSGPVRRAEMLPLDGKDLRNQGGNGLEEEPAERF
jgi:hypothetical protein